MSHLWLKCHPSVTSHYEWNVNFFRNLKKGQKHLNILFIIKNYFSDIFFNFRNVTVTLLQIPYIMSQKWPQNQQYLKSQCGAIIWFLNIYETVKKVFEKFRLNEFDGMNPVNFCEPLANYALIVSIYRKNYL